LTAFFERWFFAGGKREEILKLRVNVAAVWSYGWSADGIKGLNKFDPVFTWRHLLKHTSIIYLTSKTYSTLSSDRHQHPTQRIDHSPTAFSAAHQHTTQRPDAETTFNTLVSNLTAFFQNFE